MSTHVLVKRPRQTSHHRLITSPSREPVTRTQATPFGVFPSPRTPGQPTAFGPGTYNRSKTIAERPNYRCLTYILRIPNSRPASGRGQSRLGGVEQRERMEETEKRVLKRRRNHLAEHIQITDDLLEEMTKTGLLTPEMAAIIDSERSNLGKVSRLIDLLLAVNDDKTFSNLCQLLSRDYQWLVRDLEAEIRMENGDVEPDHDTIQEAGMLVHRKFGHNKRISQTDKREFQDLLAAKLQIAREEWDRQMDKIRTDYHIEKTKNENLEAKSRVMARQLRDFYKAHENQLTWHAHDMTSTSKALQLLSEDVGKDSVTKLQEVLFKFYDKMAKILSHRESLIDERVKSMKLLKVQSEELTLDQALRTTLQIREPSSLGGNGDQNDQDSQRTIKRLNKKISDLEQEIVSMEETISKLRQERETK